MKPKTVRKAVIPAAGYGTRMLPITKATSKVMLPVVDKPILHYIVEQLVDAGIEDIILIVRDSQPDIATYFGQVRPGIADQLRSGGPAKQELLRSLEKIQNLANFTFVNQDDSHGYGTGAALLVTEPYLGDEPFVYNFPDDLFVGEGNCYAQMIETYERYGVPIVGCQRRVGDEDYKRFGYVGGTELAPGELDVKTIIEHPGKANAPSDLASLGGFVVTPEVIPHLHAIRDSLPEGKEVYFNAALNAMLAEGKQVVAKEIQNVEYYDTGNKLGYMKTSVSMAVAHPEIGKEFQQFLKEFVQKGESNE